MTRFAVGLDLSLRGSGLVALPFDFLGADGPQWERAISATYGYPLESTATVAEKAERWLHIANGIIDTILGDIGAENVAGVYIEQYAFSRQTNQAHALAELGGVVKAALVNDHFDAIEVVTAGRARKRLLGKEPRSKKKAHVQRALIQLGCPSIFVDDADLCDAFVIANFGLGELGALGIDATAP